MTRTSGQYYFLKLSFRMRANCKTVAILSLPSSLPPTRTRKIKFPNQSGRNEAKVEPRNIFFRFCLLKNENRQKNLLCTACEWATRALVSSHMGSRNISDKDFLHEVACWRVKNDKMLLPVTLFITNICSLLSSDSFLMGCSFHYVWENWRKTINHNGKV